jgi:exodeoxyribonuclease VII small subunit
MVTTPYTCPIEPDRLYGPGNRRSLGPMPHAAQAGVPVDDEDLHRVIGELLPQRVHARPPPLLAGRRGLPAGGAQVPEDQRPEPYELGDIGDGRGAYEGHGRNPRAAALRVGNVAEEKPELSYEQARDELTDVVRRLEAGGLTLEESLALWERGERLAAICEEWLEGARARLAAAMAERAEPAERPESAPF